MILFLTLNAAFNQLDLLLFIPEMLLFPHFQPFIFPAIEQMPAQR